MRRHPLGWTALSVALCSAGAHAAEAPTREAIEAAVERVYAGDEFVYDPEPDGEWFSDALRSVVGFFEWLEELHPVLHGLLLMVLFALLVALVWHIVWTLRVSRQDEYEDLSAPLESALARLDPAPFRASAEQALAEGDRERAIRDLYLCLLIHLDRRGAIRFARHKALLDYRIETRSDQQAAAVLGRFAEVYHPGSFGRRPPDDATFARLFDAVDGIAR